MWTLENMPSKPESGHLDLSLFSSIVAVHCCDALLFVMTWDVLGSDRKLHQMNWDGSQVEVAITQNLNQWQEQVHKNATEGDNNQLK